MNAPFFSIVVPTYNRPELLKNCLRAINSQCFEDYEVVVVDDGSEARKLAENQKLVESFGEKYRLLSGSQEGSRRLGPSLIRNFAIAQSKGTFVAFCDDDDVWVSDTYLKTAHDSIVQANADLLFGSQQVKRESEIVISSSFPNVMSKLSHDQKLAAGDVFHVNREQMLTFPDYAHLNITIAKKCLLEAIGGFWAETRYAEDVDLFVRLCDSAQNILFLPEIVATHHAPTVSMQNTASTSVEMMDKRLLESHVYLHLLSVCQTSAALEYAQKSLATNYKLHFQELDAAGQTFSSRLLARLALAAMPTLKWLAYTAIKHLKS